MRDKLYEECLDNVPQEVKDYVSLETEFSNFVALVEKMREVQADFEISDMAYEYAKDHRCMNRDVVLQRAETMSKAIKLEDEVDEALKAYKRKRLEAENEEFDYGHNVKHISEE